MRSTVNFQSYRKWNWRKKLKGSNPFTLIAG
nr:MAG TPA: hypothetical protein [Bacteriophage sp.]DAR79083.1 MAG TPA: hypothetical protein [Caudoviricetes sp.]DAX12813.1 MAG TPA: hypothetical protein [Bacteriophage sp.]